MFLCSFALALSEAAWARSSGGQEGLWESRKKEGGGQVLTDIVIDPQDSDRWFALADGDLYVSYAEGNGWRPIAFDVDGVAGRGSASRHGLAFDPASPGVLFGRFNGKTRRSVDGGVTWSDDSARMEYVDGRWQVLHDVAWKAPEDTRAFARDPSNPDIVYAATGKGVFASGDGGKTWEARNAWLEEQDVVDIRVDPANTQSLVALTAHNAFRSTNGGRMWQKAAADGFETFHSRFLGILDDDGARLVAHFGTGALAVLEKGTWSNGGRSCNAVSTTYDRSGVCATKGQLVSGSFRTLAFGEDLRTAFTRPEVLRLRETPKGAVVATLDGGGALSSTDGRDWAVYQGIDGEYVRDVAEDPTGSGVVFRLSHDVAMFKSAAEGWTRRVDDDRATTVLFDPASPMRVYVASGNGKVLRSDDLGWTFQAASTGLPGSAVEDLVLDTSGNGVMWAATWGDGVYRSADGGKSWAPAGQSDRATLVRRLALDPANPDTVWAAALASGLWRTTDGGVSWQPMPTGCKVVNAVAVHPLQSEKVAVGCEDGKVVRTADGGTTWGEPTVVSDHDVRSLLYTSNDPKLVAGTAAAEVVWVGDGGEVVKNDRFKNMKIDLVSFEAPLKRGVIYGPEGMFLTTDGAKTWDPIGFAGEVVTGLQIGTDGVVAWAPGKGLMVWQDKTRRWEQRPVPTVTNRGIGKDDIDCQAPMPKDAKARLYSGWQGYLLVEPTNDGRREWYGMPGGSWMMRGDITCKSPTGTYGHNLMGIPEVRLPDWAAIVRGLGLDAPTKLEKDAEKAGVRVHENIVMADGRTFVVDRDGATMWWSKDGGFTPVGQIPEANDYRLASTDKDQSRIVIVAGTAHGVVYSTDYGKTFQAL